MSTTISATASGSLRPSTAPFPNSVTNGDFQISPNPNCTAASCPTTGDGIDELTTWTFDFTGDPDFSSFPTSLPLESALLTLTLAPKHHLITTDIVRIEGLPDIITPVIRDLAVGVTSTIQLDLLGFYSSADILGVLAPPAGQIPMFYAEDAIVSFAQLDLTAKVPAFQYAAKFVCGSSAGDIVARGAYFTAINVHNPTNTKVEFWKKFAIALPRERSGPVSEFFSARLGPDEALEIDCPDIRERTGDEADFLKGFVVIESDVELDVVALYTAAYVDRQVETLHIERVPARRREVVPSCPEQIDINVSVGDCNRDGTRTVTFDSAISLAGGGAVQARWDFGDGTSGAPFNIPPDEHLEIHNYAPGTYAATLQFLPLTAECPPISLEIEVDPCPELPAGAASSPIPRSRRVRRTGGQGASEQSSARLL